VQAGEKIGEIGFSGAANLYSHLHYQLMNGKDFPKDSALPCKFSSVTLIENGQPKFYPAIALDTGDFILNEKEHDH
jgi:murein DD-endopeptidase MepM/ murein hydrolase activator NlpD